MAPRWVTFDKMIRELGAVRSSVDSLEDTPARETAEALALRQALGEASEAVHRCLDEEDDQALVAAWAAIARAQDATRHAAGVIATARQARDASRDVRRRAAQQREAARRWRRAHEMGLAGPPDAGSAPEAAGDEDDDTDG